MRISDVLSTIQDIGTGKLPVYEKLDGQFMLFGMNKSREPLLARNQRDVDRGGVSLREMLSRQKNVDFQKAIGRACQSWQASLEGVPLSVVNEVFHNGRSFFATEIIDPSFPNVFHYHERALVIHPNGHIGVSDEDLNVLQQILDANREASFESPFFRDPLVPTPSFDLAKRVNGLIFNHQVIYAKDITLEELVREKLLKMITTPLFLTLPMEVRKSIAGKIMGEDISLKELTQWVAGREQKQELKNLISNGKRHALKAAWGEIDEIFLPLEMALLDCFQSDFVHNSDFERDRLWEETLSAQRILKEMEGTFHEITREEVPALEGVVFDVDGQTCKITGAFPFLNKNANATRPKRRVGIFPGKFKPPHLGHFAQIQELVDLGLDEVRVFISPKEIDGFSAQRSMRALGAMCRHLPQVSIHVTKESPVVATYEAARSLTPGTSLYVACGSKETDGRFRNLSDWLERQSLPVRAVICHGTQNDRGITGTAMRRMIKEGDREGFDKGMPDHLSPLEKTKIWEMMRN